MKPKQIILHHSLTKDNQTVSWGAIRKFHKSYAYKGKIISKEEADYCIASGQHVKKPWGDIGYHFGIELVNDSYEILMGRMPNVQGAHCRGHNKDSIGVCFIGNYDIDTPSKGMIDKGVSLITYLCKVYNISSSQVYGHCEYSSKTCPGARFDLNSFKSKINAALISPDKIKAARRVIRDAFSADPNFRFGYQSNIAMLLHDHYGITDHKIRNAAASEIIKLIFE